MISFRYHIVSLVAAVVMFGVGIVVGTTVLNGPVTNDLRHQVDDLKSDRSDLATQNKVLQGQVDNADQFAVTFGTQLVSGALKDDDVLVVALPGASSGMVDGTANLLAAAGAKITGRLELTNAFVDPAQGESIRSLATGPSHPPTLTLPETDDARVLGAALLSYVLVGKGEATDLKSVLSGFSGLHMITSDPASIAPATNVVVIGNGAQVKNTYAGDAELDIVSQLVAAQGHVVVAGDTDSAQGNGVVALVRNGATKSTVATVDNADSAFGQVSTALALANVIDGQIGQYGTAKGAQALFPSTSK